VVIRRGVGVALCAAALLLGLAGPAAADDNLTVTVTGVEGGSVNLIAGVASASTTDLPKITVAFDEQRLDAEAAVLQAAPNQTAARAVVIVIDTSGSMAGAPLQAARDAALDFAAAVPADLEIGLVAVADTPKTLTRPTRDRAAVRTAVAGLQASGGTALYAGLRQANGLLAGYAERRLLVLSDGQDTVSAGDAQSVTAALVAAKTVVDVVAFRAVFDGLNRLRQLAAATGGTAYPAANTVALAGAFRTAAGSFQLRLAITVTVPPELSGRAGTLKVVAESGGVRSAAAVPVQLAKLAPPPPRTVVAARPLFGAPTLAIVGLAFAALLCLALLVTAPLARWGRKERLEQVERFRLATRAAARAAGQVAGAASPAPDGTIAQAVLGLSDRMVKARGQEGRIAQSLDRAGMTLRPHEWAVLRGVVTVLGGLLLTLPLGIPGFLLGAVVGWLAAGLYRSVRQSRRATALADQLPDALQLIIGSLKSGFSLTQAVDAVTRDATPGPITAEFGRAMAETRIGMDVGDALERVAERTKNDDLAWAVMAVRIQRETGGNLAEVLETTVDTIRERDRLRRHVRALSAEGRLSAYILVAMPIVLGLWMFTVRREYLRPLWTTPLGLVMLAGSGVLVVVGAFWMSRWVKVEV
jgi:Flp pilus assembly protein TadB/Mg-chelatase subunit ChlD